MRRARRIEEAGRRCARPAERGGRGGWEGEEDRSDAEKLRTFLPNRSHFIEKMWNFTSF